MTDAKPDFTMKPFDPATEPVKAGPKTFELTATATGTGATTSSQGQLTLPSVSFGPGREELLEIAAIGLQRLRREPPLVVIADISGSMSRYSRMLLHFMHAVTNDRDRVHTFLFGTRLTNVTRYLRYKDIDVALEKVAGAVQDWSGGTRIGDALATLNREHGRRLGRGSAVVILSDGWDRGDPEVLAEQMQRLQRVAHRVVWVNPLAAIPCIAGVPALWLGTRWYLKRAPAGYLWERATYARLNGVVAETASNAACAASGSTASRVNTPSTTVVCSRPPALARRSDSPCSPELKASGPASPAPSLSRSPL